MPIFASNITFPNATLKAAAEEICGSDVNCLFDIAATLSTTFGQTTLNNSAVLQSDNEVIGKNMHFKGESDQKDIFPVNVNSFVISTSFSAYSILKCKLKMVCC